MPDREFHNRIKINSLYSKYCMIWYGIFLITDILKFWNNGILENWNTCKPAGWLKFPLFQQSIIPPIFPVK